MLKIKFESSDKLNELLQAPEAKKWTSDAIIAIGNIYKAFLGLVHESKHESCTLSGIYLVAAVESAYLDLRKMGSIHDLNGGPSCEKVGAAWTYWLNHFHPIQVAETVELAESDWILQLNPTFALYAGLTYKYRGYAKGDNMHSQIAEKLAEAKDMHDFIYHLTWRNPSFKDIAMMFELIK